MADARLSAFLRSRELYSEEATLSDDIGAISLGGKYERSSRDWIGGSGRGVLRDNQILVTAPLVGAGEGRNLAVSKDPALSDYQPNMRVTYLAMDGLRRFFAAVSRRDPKFATDWANQLTSDSERARAFVADAVVGLIATLALSVTDEREKPLQISHDGRFATELQLELLSRIPMAPLEGSPFLTQLYADLHSFISNDGVLDGAWGRLVHNGTELEIHLSPSLYDEIQHEVADLVAAGRGRTAAKIRREHD